MLDEFRVSVTIEASKEKVWRKLVDWESQGEWMLLTTVESSDRGAEDSGIGTTIDAFTGIGRFGILDRMKVTEWRPPEFCSVLHYGKLIRGRGDFTLVDIGPDKVRFDWYEKIEAPRILLLLIKPGVLAGVYLSLRRFANSFR